MNRTENEHFLTFYITSSVNVTQNLYVFMRWIPWERKFPRTFAPGNESFCYCQRVTAEFLVHVPMFQLLLSICYGCSGRVSLKFVS